MPTADSRYACREPGCPHSFADKDPGGNRSARNDHERRHHSNSPHRVWECPLGDGPGVHDHYTEDALRIHMFKSHFWKGADWKQAYPRIRERREALLDELWATALLENTLALFDAPPENTPQTAPESTETAERDKDDLELDPEVVIPQLRHLLETWQAHEDRTGELEAALAELRSQNETLEQENKTLEAEASWLRHVIGEVRALVKPGATVGDA